MRLATLTFLFFLRVSEVSTITSNQPLSRLNSPQTLGCPGRGDMCVAESQTPFRIFEFKGTPDSSNRGLSDGAYLYVLTRNGNLMLAKANQKTMIHSCAGGAMSRHIRFNHACFLSRNELVNIIGAGQLTMRNQAAWIVDNFSGHFLPPDETLAEVKHAIKINNMSGTNPPLLLGWNKELTLRGVADGKNFRHGEVSRADAVMALRAIDEVKESRRKFELDREIFEARGRRLFELHKSTKCQSSSSGCAAPTPP
jgi:hypothetical protein